MRFAAILLIGGILLMMISFFTCAKDPNDQAGQNLGGYGCLSIIAAFIIITIIGLST